MKIYVAHSGSFDYKKELYFPIRNSTLNEKYEFIFPHENSSEPFNSRENLKSYNLMIAEVSYPSTGEGLELGWADLYRIPIVCIYKAGSKISNSLKIITSSFLEYNDSQDMINKLDEYLSK